MLNQEPVSVVLRSHVLVLSNASRQPAHVVSIYTLSDIFDVTSQNNANAYLLINLKH